MQSVKRLDRLVLFEIVWDKASACWLSIAKSCFSTLFICLTLFGAANVNATFCPEYTGRGLDYTNPENQGRLDSIADVHFTEDVRMLRRGSTTYLARDIEYLLNWSPNHHQALAALTRLALREGKTTPDRARVDLECRFLWARKTQPRDAMVLVIQGSYYSRAGRFEEAKKTLKEAARMAPENPEINYNLGLALYNLEDYESARSYARKAYNGGYPLPGLRNMLERAGYPLSD